MGRLRKHLKNKETGATEESKTTATAPTTPRGSRIRKRTASTETTENTSTVSSTVSTTPPKPDPILRKKATVTKEPVNETVEPSTESTKPVEEAVKAPRVHAAPRRVHAAPATTLASEENVENTVAEEVESVAISETYEEPAANEDVSQNNQTTVSNIEEEATSSVIEENVTETQSVSKKRSTLHAAPPEAYLRVQRAATQTQLGSAVVSPPPAMDTSTGKRSNKWEMDDNEGSQDKNKGTKEKRSNRRRNRDWSSVDSDSETVSSSPKRRSNRRKKGAVQASPKAKAIKRRVMIDGSITVSDLAHAMSQKAGAVIKVLLNFGEMATLNDTLDFETASTVATEFEFEAIDTSFQEDQFLITEKLKEEGDLRPPVVTIMGHVDHGKTTLLDTIRNANVAGGEAGGITQHTSAYQVKHEGQLITFIDTPGHEAFTAMRARGAQVTDIVILVVAADDGPMPQTIEALNHARASGVQLMVAVNKCDKPGANPDKVRQDMMRYELVSEEYGGDTIFVNVSALKGEGIDELLENITLLSEMGEYRAPIKRHAEGFVLEARLEKGRGAVATLLVKSGTLKQGDTIVLGNVWGRVRALYDYNGKSIKEALPSTPIEVIGLQEVPSAGDDFVVVKKPKDAKALVAHRAEEAKQKALEAAKKSVSLEELLRRQVEGEPVKLNLIIKSDVGGTLEAMKGSIAQINVPGTEVNILHAAIGGITESDVSLAHTYDGIIIGFNVRPDAKARSVVNQTNVEVRTYSIIYEALEDLEKGLKGLLEPEIKEQWKGSAEIRETFNVPKVGTVAGCFVLDGSIARKHRIRLLRDGTIMWEGKLASLRRFKDDVREVEKGYECGMNLDGFNDIKVGDQLEAFMMEEEERE
jgi:translation initiation factor IF-2